MAKQLICLCPGAHDKQVPARRAREAFVFSGEMKEQIGRRNHNVQDRVTEQAGLLRHGRERGLGEIRCSHRGKIHNLIEVRIEIGVGGNCGAMAGDLGIIDLSIEGGIHNFPAGIDLEDDRHKGA